MLYEVITVGELPPDSPISNRPFHVYVTEVDDINAIALPGSNIIVFSGLLQNIQSENELVMVLGHELGHYAHKDHLRGLGRGLGISLVITSYSIHYTKLYEVKILSAVLSMSSMLQFQPVRAFTVSSIVERE